MFATPKVADHGDELGKDDLLHALAVFTPTDYDPETETRYGTSATLLAHVVIVDGPHAGKVEPRFYCAGNLARQIGDALDVGTKAPGRIRKGKSANGKDWYGIEWATEAADLQTAEAAVLATNAPTTLGAQARAAVANAKAAPTAPDGLPPF